MNGIIYALLGTAFTFLLTTLGAANVFFVKKNVNQNVQCLFLGFAGGVMIAASIWSLLVPGIEAAQSNHQIGWLVTSGGFLLGVVLLLTVDFLLKGKLKKLQKEYMEKQNEDCRTILSAMSNLKKVAGHTATLPTATNTVLETW